MNKTQIEWCLNPDGSPGYTFNPITGCLNNCPYCYARKLANTRLETLYLANTNVAPTRKYEGGRTYQMSYGLPNNQTKTITPELALQNPFYPRFWEDRLERAGKELYRTKPRGIFVCDMSDLFGIGIPKEWTERVLATIEERPQHRFYLLTKQPQNLLAWSPFPSNCFVGVSVTNQKMFVTALNWLDELEAKVKYISFEPLLESIPVNGETMRMAGISWVILGSQTKPYKPPKIEWVREIVEACDKAGIPVFLKNNLKPLLQQNDHNIYSYPEWAGKQFAVTGDHSLAPVSPHSNEAMRDLRQDQPK